ncbi:oxidoreductase [Leptospira sp. SA-E8]|uniref:oxidoreductase n=1 Tax=Leptospira sp. SA-E8 TaxID=3422259 RepID=UPI003EBF3EEF
MQNRKVILITGASSGIGKITAIKLVEEGHIVYGAGRNLSGLNDLIDRGGHAIIMDMSSQESIEKGVRKVISEQGKIDVLWNNAGFGLFGPVEDISIEKARYQFEVNLFGLADITRKVLPFMREARTGLIINTSSMGGKIYTPLGAWYHATKHALEGFSDCLRLELREFGINVVVLEPGLIETGFTDGVLGHFPRESAEGPYRRIVDSILSAAKKKAIRGSDPELIAKTVRKIITAKNPKTRYLIGKLAKPLVYIRRIFGDKIFDKILLSQLR